MTLLESEPVATERITVTGVVQGVGFRPFVARLAHELAVTGSVWNTSTAVHVDVTAPLDVVDEFVRRLIDDAPPLARIVGVERAISDAPRGDSFVIVESDAESGAKSLVPPDAAVCADCLRELHDPSDRRFGHPFITCTNCGPRFTIIRDLPYDRPTTTMAGFDMCPACRSEYEDPLDRRHHAQPIGCHDCGPRLSWRTCTATPGAVGGAAEDPGELLDRAVEQLVGGAIVAVKGLGGFQLVCRADRDEAVGRLRDRKHRPDKPLAVMVGDVPAARLVAEVNDVEAAELSSPAAPIVLLVARPSSLVSDVVAPGDPLVGVMLPSTPLHHLLFDRWMRVAGQVPLVVTSANASGAPICHRDDQLDEVVAPLADAVLTHDRPIHAACDDSVVREVGGEIVPLRRARGYAPMPVAVGAGDRRDEDQPVVLAVGGELKNTVGLAVGGMAHLSPHVGDLENLATLEAFEQRADDLSRFHEVVPDVVVADLHPDYLGTRWAQKRHADRLRLVQHHHSHVAAVMAEHGLDPHRPVLGVAFDGTGYGTDGTIWGGEFLVADASGFERVAHLDRFLLPGGEAAVHEPWRTAMSLLHHAGVTDADDLAPASVVSPRERSLVTRQLDRSIACTPTSSMGRLFDGVASLLGVRHRVTFEAHAAIELEVVAGRATARATRLAPLRVDDDGVVSFDDTVRSLVDAVRSGAPIDELAAGFHDAIADAVATVVDRDRARADDVVALTGGVFQNARLVAACRDRLVTRGVRVLTHRLVPPNDGGLSLGQAWIGTHTRRPDSPSPEGNH